MFVRRDRQARPASPSRSPSPPVAGGKEEAAPELGMEVLWRKRRTLGKDTLIRLQHVTTKHTTCLHCLHHVFCLRARLAVGFAEVPPMASRMHEAHHGSPERKASQTLQEGACPSDPVLERQTSHPSDLV